VSPVNEHCMQKLNKLFYEMLLFDFMVSDNFSSYSITLHSHASRYICYMLRGEAFVNEFYRVYLLLRS